MIWRSATEEDTPAILDLTREPMDGKIRISWGMSELNPPPECRSLKVGVLENEGKVMGTGMSWEWPGGDLYLSGLRLASGLAAHPPLRVWKQAYAWALRDRPFAWTTIGKENRPARRMLERGGLGLPVYRPLQELRTWFIPCKRKGGDESTWASHRFVSVASGSGWLYRAGRLADQLGLPGIPKPGKRIRIAYLEVNRQNSPEATVARILDQIHSESDMDGRVLVLPLDSEISSQWISIAPRYSFTWDSLLYGVSGEARTSFPEIPEWKAGWL
jgi:hypothetical protein